MIRSFTLTLFAVFVLSVGPAQAQIDDSCPLCIKSPPAGTFSERHYQRQQRQQSQSFEAPSYDYDRGYTPGQNRYTDPLSSQNRWQDPTMNRGAEYMWDTPERQMQQESLAIQEYNAGYGCNSWSLDGC